MPYHRPDVLIICHSYSLAHCVNLCFNVCVMVRPFPSIFTFCGKGEYLLVYERNNEEPSLEHTILHRGV